MSRDELVATEAAAICKRYKTDIETATRELRAAVDSRPELRLLFDDDDVSDRDIVRRRDYKDAVTDARKRLYYSLRRYRPSESPTDQLVDPVDPNDIDGTRQQALALLAQHVSTAERIDDYPALLDQIDAAIGDAHQVVDLGCGVHPLAYIAFDVDLPDRYLALDKDPWSINQLKRFIEPARPARLDARLVDLAADFSGLGGPGQVAVMLKYLTVLERTNAGSALAMITLPFERIIVTGSTEALAKRRSIAARERHDLRALAETAGRPIIGEIDVASETGFVLGPADGDDTP